MFKLTKITAGEYEFHGGSISRDEYESNLWWLRFDGYEVAEDCRTLSEAKSIAEKRQGE